MFKAPSSIPQDLLLIHDIVSQSLPGPSELKPHLIRNANKTRESSVSTDSNGSSSESETDSDEVNIVESLLAEGAEDEDRTVKLVQKLFVLPS